MGILPRLRAWSNEHRSSDGRGFTLVELLMTIVILGALGAMTGVALAGFDDAASAISCPSDTSRLKRAESTFFRQQARYGSEADLVGAGLLDTPSDVHDITAASLSYSISEVGRCVGSNTTYSISAPTVGTSVQAGVTVAVTNPDGTAVPDAVVSYSQGSWTTMGTTGPSGQVNAALANGSYDFRVVLRGTTNTLTGVAVTQGALVTFPTVNLTVSLVDSAGAPLSGGSVSITSSGGSASSLGTTTGAGAVSAQVLPAVYDVTMTYAGRSMTQTGISVNAAKTVTFQTHALTVRLQSAGGGAPLAGGVVTATPTGGAASALGTTNASGTVVATLLDGAYTVSMTYNGVTTTQSVTLTADTTITFTASGSVTATLRMLSSTGTGLTGQDAAIWWRAAGASSWTFAGYPNASGAVSFTANAGNYDFRARWFGAYETKTSVPIGVGTVVTFQAVAVTEFMRASTGTGLTGQDAAIWLRPAGTSSWYFSGYPNASGQVVQQILQGSYDFRARWFGAYNLKSAITVNAATTVTFQALRVQEFIQAPGGGGISGQDAAIWLRPAGTSSWYFSGYPDGNGHVIQQVFEGSYDFRARWFGAYDLKSAVLVNNPTTVKFDTVKVTEFMRASGGGGLSGQDAAVWLRPAGTSSWYFSGYPNGGGHVNQNVFVGSYDFQARWFGAYDVKTAIAVSGPTTITFQAVAATEFMRSSTGTGLTGQDAAIWLRPAGTASWYFSGYPNASGQVVQQVFNGNYDFQARWFGAYDVKTAIAVTAPVTVTFQAVAVTEFLRSSTGTGLTGQDSAIWLRPTGTASWYFSGYPNASGQVVQQVFNGSYEFRARWFGALQVSAPTAVAAPVTVTFQAYAVTEFLRASTGTGLTGQDSAMWVRPNGTASWFFSGYPNASGQVVQQLLAGSYDFRARWLGTLEVSPPTAISADATVTFQAAGIDVTARKASDNSLVSGATVYVITAGTNYNVGTTDATGKYLAQVLVSTVGVRCTKSPITGTNSNLVVPAGGIATTVMMA